MNITFQPINNVYNNFKFNAKTPATGAFYGALTQDVFQRSENVGFTGLFGAQKTERPWNVERVTEVYNRTYDDVMSKMPIVKDLKIEKPEVMFETVDDANFAAYSLLFNMVTISPQIKDDFYLYAFVDEKKNITSSLGVIPASAMSEFGDISQQYDNLEIIKLTDKEKEKFIQATFAHELRHCVQQHAMLSTEGTSNIYSKLVEMDAADMRHKLIDLICHEDQAGYDSSRDRYFLCRLDYASKYEPRRFLAPDTKFKISTHPADRRYLSVRDHLLESYMEKRRTAKMPSRDAYYAQPHEADAYNFQFEYFDSIVPDKDEKDLRRNVLNGVMLGMFNDARDALANMSVFGYQPVIYK